MKELFERLTRYGPRWDLFFRVGVDNTITMHLSYLDEDRMRVFSDFHIIPLAAWEHGYVLNILDKMHQHVQKLTAHE